MRAACVLVAALALAASAAGQALPQGMPPQAAPAPPETLTVWLDAPDVPAPRLVPELTEVPLFGAPWLLDLDFGAETVTLPDSLAASVPWLRVVPAPATGSEPTGVLGLEVRAYRAGPMRLGWGGDPGTLTPVFHVRGRLMGDEQSAPVRDPWRVARRWWPLALIAVVVAVLLALVFAALRRRRGSALEHLDGPALDPAWTTFAVGADELAAGGMPDGAAGAASLERVASLVRGYLTARFGVPGGSLVPGEVDDVLAARGLLRGTGRPFDELLSEIDLLRYAPGGVPAGGSRRCLEAAVVAVRATAGRRGAPGLPASRRLAAEAAWKRLPTGADGGAS